MDQTDQTYLQRNAAGLQRLRAFMAGLSDDDLAREIDADWTVGAVFAHLAYWDRFLAARWAHATRHGLRAPDGLPDHLAALTNEAALAGWRACPPRVAAQQAVAAAEHTERLIAGLAPDRAAEAIAGGRPALVERTRHWSEHLDQIAAALGRAAPLG
jgi:hypothetical protein